MQCAKFHRVCPETDAGHVTNQQSVVSSVWSEHRFWKPEARRDLAGSNPAPPTNRFIWGMGLLGVAAGLSRRKLRRVRIPYSSPTQLGTRLVAKTSVSDTEEH